MDTGANFSPCRKYRYVLWRTWERGESHVIFVGLNPSTADERKDDPTIRRCIGFAKAWGFGGIFMLNIFAFRTIDPKELKKINDPIGPENNNNLQIYFHSSGLNVACWGNYGEFMGRGDFVIELLGKKNLSYLGVTKSGQPKHPLYLKRDTKPKSLLLFDEILALKGKRR